MAILPSSGLGSFSEIADAGVATKAKIVRSCAQHGDDGIFERLALVGDVDAAVPPIELLDGSLVAALGAGVRLQGREVELVEQELRLAITAVAGITLDREPEKIRVVRTVLPIECQKRSSNWRRL
ncbi:hypothetical protein ACRAVF_13170 [Bradyrhizobium oligotrophicum S58]